MINEKELNKELREFAISNGLCNKWQREWREDWDKDKMVSQFYRGIDFYIKNRFVSNDFLKNSFDVEFLRSKGILVDDTYSLLNPENAILIGKSSSNIRFNDRNISTLYILDKSKAKITAKGKSFVMVHLFGMAEVEAEQESGGEVVAIVHSTDCVVSSDSGVKIKYEFDYLR